MVFVESMTFSLEEHQTKSTKLKYTKLKETEYVLI